MPKVTFKFDKEKDLFNIWETCILGNSNSLGHDFTKNLSQEVVLLCIGKSFDGCKKDLSNHFDKIHSSNLILIFLESVNRAWKEINNEFFNRLENIMKKPIYRRSFIGYLTVAGRCPFSVVGSTFYFNFFSSLSNALETAGHEIMHLQFYYNFFSEIEEKIGHTKAIDLMEALTVLLNLEFKDLWFIKDKGYEKHKELREFITREWEKEKDFDVLMKKCVDYLKNNHSI
jgi:hypothetical protein